MSIRTISNWNTISKLAEEWAALLDASSPESMFLSYEWHDALQAAHGRGMRLRTLVWENAGRIAAIWPLHYARRRMAHVLSFRTIADGGTWFVPHNGIATRVDPTATVARFFSYLSEQRDWDIIRVFGLIADGVWHAAYRTVADRFGLRVFEEPGPTSPYLQMPATWDEYFATRDKRFRKNARRWQRNMASLDSAQVVLYDAPDDERPVFDAILAIERRSWKATAGFAISDRPWEELFYRRLWQGAARRGWAEAAILQAAGRPIAYKLGLKLANRYASLKTSYVEEYRLAGPGLCLREHHIRSLFDRGFREHDFIGEADNSKLQWADTVRRHVNMMICRPTPNADLLGAWRWVKENRSDYFAKRRTRVPVLSSSGLNARFRIVHDWASLRGRADEWNALLDGSLPEHKFLTFEWCDALRQARSRDRDIPVLVSEDAGRLTAVWPLVFATQWLGGIIPCRVLADVSLWFSPHHGMVCEGDRSEQIHKCLQFARDRLSRWDVLEIGRLVENGETHRAIEAACRRLGLVVESRPGGPSPYLPLEATWESYLAGCSSKFRSDLKRCEKSVAQLGRVEYRRFDAASELAAAYGSVMEIERGSWKHSQGSAISSRPWEETFYNELCRRAGPRGWLQITLLMVDGQPIAHDVGLVYQGRYACLKTSFVERVRSSNPGKVLRRHVIESLYARGIREHDFLGEAESWKTQWTKSLRPHVSLTIYRRKWYANLVDGLRRLKALRAATPAGPGVDTTAL